MIKIGIDLGGTKTEIIALDIESGAEVYRHRVKSPRNDYQATLNILVFLIDEVEKQFQSIASIGIGIPGSISSQTQTIKNGNSTWLIGKSLQKDLEDRLQRSINIENDANCFTLSEATDGAGANYPVVFGVIIGTGCGGGLSVDKKVIKGVNGISGEWGHNPLPFPKVLNDSTHGETHFDRLGKASAVDMYTYSSLIEYTTENVNDVEYPGPACYCGKRGCLETWISGSGLQRDYHLVYGEALSAQDIVVQAEQGRSNAVATMERYYERLAKSLAQIINTIDPDVIVLGGGMSNIDHIYQQIPQRWKKYIFSDTCSTLLLKAKFGDSSGVRGAAWLQSAQQNIDTQ